MFPQTVILYLKAHTVPCCFSGYPILGLGLYNHEVGCRKKGTGYEPTGSASQFILGIAGLPLQGSSVPVLNLSKMYCSRSSLMYL